MSFRSPFSKELKVRLLADSDQPSPRSPLQSEVNNLFLTDLIQHAGFLDSLKVMRDLCKSHDDKLDTSYFAHIRTSIRDVRTHSIMRAEIMNEMENNPPLLKAYRRFNQALNELEQARDYFLKKPVYNNQAFINLHSFHQSQYKAHEKEINKMLSKCEEYRNFVANVIAVCDKTDPTPAQLIS